MKKTLGVLFGILLTLPMMGQYKIQDGSDLLTLQKVPLEKMYVHHTAPLLFSGEYLYYKVYCFNAQTNRLSRISRVAYISLINEKGEAIFEHKLRLDKGMAQGDFFVNTNIPSGNYKLVGFTNWMNNGGEGQIFSDDIAIINPYRVDNESVLFREINSQKTVKDENSPNSNGTLLEIQLDSTVYTNRSRVELTLRNYKGQLAHGEYSLAIKRKEKIKVKTAKTSEVFAKEYLTASKIIPQGVGDSIFLPEQRGELLFGKVVNKATGTPAETKNLTISIPGEEYILKSATTNEEGRFFSYLRKQYKRPETILQVLDDGDYEIRLGEKQKLPFDKLDFGNFTMSKSDSAAIRERSLYNQIENGFFDVKPDSILALDEIDPFDGGIPEVFNLDDYTRFPTLQETLIEILNTVGYRNGKNGNDYIRVAQDFEKFNEPYNDYPAIVLIDGVFIPNHEEIKDFKATQIATIRVLRDQLVMGSNQYQGIVSFETKNGDYFETYSNDNALVSTLNMPEPRKNYYRQDYSPAQKGAYKRIPDYRNILLWEPFIKIDSPEHKLVFYTSDIDGDFEILLEGFTTYGKPVSMRKIISIE